MDLRFFAQSENYPILLDTFGAKKKVYNCTVPHGFATFRVKCDNPALPGASVSKVNIKKEDGF